MTTGAGVKSELRTALVTGASSGIGREMARWWAARGVRVYAAARRVSALEALRAEAGPNIEPVELDVSREAAAVERIRALDEACGGFDIVLANAGVGGPTPAQSATWEEVEAVLRVNVMGAAATLTAVLPRMVERGRGRVAGVASLAGWRGLGAYSCYSGSKAFLATFLESLRVDLHGTPVRVTCIEPGFVKSEMLAQIEGRAPLVFVAETADAAAVFCRAVEAGDARVAYPKVHAAAMGAISCVPRFAFDALARRASEPQRALAAEQAARRLAEKK